jgi:hypothetical protein
MLGVKRGKGEDRGRGSKEMLSLYLQDLRV